jgi:hypothetical protein
MKRRPILAICVFASLVLVMASAPRAATAHTENAVPSVGLDLAKIADNGFGDRQNNYAWSMEEFNGDIYVGTGRGVDTFNIMWEQLWAAMDPGVRPPELPDVDHPPFLQDFLQRDATYGFLVKDPDTLQEWVADSRAEIWRYRKGKWARVYQSPLVNSYLRDADDPSVLAGYQVAKTSGFRSMITFTDKNRVKGLYATSGGLSFALPAQQNMLYRTTNGTNWTPLSTPAGMGRESRAMAVLNGKLYIGVGGAAGAVHASVWCSDDPASGNWTKVMDFTEPGLDSSNQGIKSMCAYNGKLYVGTQNRDGYQVYRSTTGAPAGNDSWVRVVTDGAGDRYNANAQTMKVFNGKLYITSLSLPFISDYDEFKGFEMIRVNPNDSWELVMGAYTPVDPPSPEYENRVPISGRPAGFGNPMAFYGWSMEVYNGYLYVGDLDTSVFLRYLDDYEGSLPDIPGLGLLAAAAQLTAGCDLWRSRDGVNWSSVTVTGFKTPENYGFRTMKATSKGLFLGTANPFDGCEIWLANSSR